MPKHYMHPCEKHKIITQDLGRMSAGYFCTALYKQDADLKESLITSQREVVGGE
jgi:hypothetical protein